MLTQAEILETLQGAYDLEPIERTSAPATRWRYADGGGRDRRGRDGERVVLLDSCDRVRITADGQFRSCLFATDETDVRALLRDGVDDDVDRRGARARVSPSKWAGHQINQVHFIRPRRSMSEIGGSRCHVDHGFTHLDPLGRARMVDVTPKEPTHRRAIARGRVHMTAETASAVAQGAIKKGDVLAVARVAGIQAAKRASDLIPLCHPLMVGAVTVNFEINEDFDRDRGGGRHVRPHRGRDGSAHRVLGRGADDLRHVQVDGQEHGDRRSIALWEKTGGASPAPYRASRTRSGTGRT